MVRDGVCNHSVMSTEQSPEATEISVACPSRPLTVLYDGACPLCRREIGLYQRLTPEQPVTFVDVTDTDSLPVELSRDVLLARFHVLRADGSVESGARAFLALWAAFPGWRWLARIGYLPGGPAILEIVYRGFLRIRPWMQRLAAKWDRGARRPAD